MPKPHAPESCSFPPAWPRTSCTPGAQAGDPHREHRPGCRRPGLDRRETQLAAQRAPLRRAAGQEQSGDARRVRPGAVHDLAAFLRCSTAAVADDSEFSQSATPGTPASATVAENGMPQRRPERMLPYWFSDITVDLAAGRTVLVTAHGNSLRALVKHLDSVSDDEITGLNIPTGIPLVYELDDSSVTRRASTSTRRRRPPELPRWRRRARRSSTGPVASPPGRSRRHLRAHPPGIRGTYPSHGVSVTEARRYPEPGARSTETP